MELASPFYLDGALSDGIAPAWVEPPPKPPVGVPGLDHETHRYGNVSIPFAFEHKHAVSDLGDRIRLFRKMRRTSIAVAIGGDCLRTTLGTAVPMMSRKKASDEAAELLAAQWGLDDYDGAGYCEQSLDDIIDALSLAIEDGAFALAEEWAEVDGRFFMVRYHVRHLDTVAHVFTHQGRLAGFGQMVAGQTDVVPMSRMLFVVRQPAIGGVFGNGVLRACVGSWEDEQSNFGQLRVGVDRHVNPTPVIQADPGYVGLPAVIQGDPGLEADKAAVGTMMSQYRGSARSWLYLQPHHKLSTFGGEYDIERLDKSIGARQREILERYGAGVVAQGRPGSGGALSMVSEQRDASREQWRQQLKLLFSAINKQTCARLFHYNMPGLPRRERPSLTFTGLRSAAFAERLSELIGAKAEGMLTWSAEDERALRSESDLPGMTTEAEAVTTAERNQRPRGERASAGSVFDRARQRRRENTQETP